MKLDKISTLIIAAVIILAAILFFKKNKSAQEQSKNVAHNVLQSVTVGRVNSAAKNTVQGKAPAIVEAPSLAACGYFLSNQSGANLDETVNTILNQSSQKEILERTEYQLIANDQREIVVQFTLDEEPKNKVRVLRIADDGFPDRIKNFPSSKGSVEDQLQGALTLGTLKNKIEKYSVNQGNGILLKFEKSKNKVVRINYSNGRNQLLCEDAKCLCQTF